MKKVILIFFLFFVKNTFAWYSHFLFTEFLYQKKLLPKALDIKIEYKPLEKFLLSVDNQKLKEEILNFYRIKSKIYPYKQWLLTKKMLNILNSKDKFSVNDFIYVLGLNNNAFLNVKFTQYFKDFYKDFNIQGTKQAYQFLAFFSDEPDFGFDDYLFNNNDDRYTKIPYGNYNTLGSRAPFHLYFNNESNLVYLVKPALKESMSFLRFYLFFRLASFAKNNNEIFWAIRFFANSLHYLQDIIQPYHSSALPNANIKFYLKYLISLDKNAFTNYITRQLANSHEIYEFIAYKLFLYIINNNLDYIKIQKEQALNNNKFIDNIDKLKSKFDVCSYQAYKKSFISFSLISDIFNTLLSQHYDKEFQGSFPFETDILISKIDLYNFFNIKDTFLEDKKHDLFSEILLSLNDTLKASIEYIYAFF